MHHAGCEMPHRYVRRKCSSRRFSASSLTDSLRSVVRLRRADSPFSKAVTPLSTESGDNPGKNMCAKKRRPRERPRHRRFFHRLRPPDEHHKNRRSSQRWRNPTGLKDTRRFPPEAPSCALLFRPCRLPDTCPPFSLREAWRFLIAHAVGISVRCRSFAPSWAVCTNPPFSPTAAPYPVTIVLSPTR
ncbi:hypothetical protein EC11E007_49500 [Escherichia coli]|nr:hypothetical protein EC11E007_49500 [Escherichia coli]